MSTQTLLLYLATWSLVALTPGPAVMCSAAQATRHGFWASCAGISGIQTGNLLFFVCVSLGLGTLLATATTAFAVLRFAGAVYLFYLGVRIVRSTLSRAESRDMEPVFSQTSRRSLFAQGLLVQLTNPKALLFVSALLPQFIDPHRSLPLQLGVLALATVLVDSIVLSSYALLAQRTARSFRKSRGSLWLERFFGTTLVFFGIRLLLSRK